MSNPIPPIPAWRARLKQLAVPLAILLAMCVGFGLLQTGNSQPAARVKGMTVTPPEGFAKTHSDGRYVIWKYTGNEKKPGSLILDAEIRGDYGQLFPDADAVLAQCPWLQEAEIYENPYGVRMVRGYSMDYSEYPERRYYVESQEAVFLLSMNEDSRYYSPADCEEALRQTADSIRPNRR